MYRSSLLELIKALQPNELQDLLLFVASPYFTGKGNDGQEARLLKVILQAAPHFAAQDLMEEQVFAQVFDGKPYVKGKLDKLMTQLHKLVRHFLLVEHYLQNPNLQLQHTLDWADILQKRGLDGRYNATLEKAGKLLDEVQQESSDVLQLRFRLELEHYKQDAFAQKKKDAMHIPESIRALDTYYLQQRLQLTNHLLLLGKEINLNFSPADEEMLRLPQIAPHHLSSSALLHLNYAIFALLSTRDLNAGHFEQLNQLIAQVGAQIHPTDLRNAYTYLNSLCIALVNSGRQEFIPVLHQLQRENLERGYLFFDGKLTAAAYLNISRNAIWANQHEWAADFIETYKEQIAGNNETHDFYRLNRAELLFANAQYETALDLLPANFAQIDYHLIARRLELKIYFEMGSDLFPYKLNAFKLYVFRLSKNLLSEELKEFQNNFVNLLNQIATSPRGDKHRSALLVKRIQNKKLVAERNWLLKKAENL